MSVNVDAVNERLNGLVTLLQAVGVDSIDKGEVSRVSKNLHKGDLPLPDARQLNDDQIEAIIKKLQQAQTEAPQIIAALEAHAEARSLTGGARGSQYHEEEEEEDDDEEEDDEFDEDANYPMVGQGCSDDCSVVSDLTTPTVCTGVPVPEEEHYRDTLPPMIVGGGGSGHAPPMMVAPPKRKNLVNQVRPSQSGMGIQASGRRGQPANSRIGGAAAARRKQYQDTMTKLHENPNHVGYVGPSGVKKGGSSKAGSSRSGDRPKKSRPKQRNSGSENFSDLAAGARGGQWDSGGDQGWNAFESKPKSKSKSSTMIDDDGFLVGESFDPFASGGGSNPFKSSAGDLAFGKPAAEDPFSSNSSADGFDAFGNPGSTRKSRKKPDQRTQPNFSQQQSVRKERSSGSSSSGSRPRRSRRASLAM